MNSLAESASAAFQAEDTVFLLGRPCRVAVAHSVWRRVALDGETLRVSLCHESDVARVRKLLDEWFLEQARQVLPTCFAETLEQYGWRIRKPRVPLLMRPADRGAGLRLSVRRMRSRWGSCAMNGHITLGAELVHLPRRLIDYVAVHELCHLAHPNHSPAFWFQVATCLPDWRQRRGELKQWQARAHGQAYAGARQ